MSCISRVWEAQDVVAAAFLHRLGVADRSPVEGLGKSALSAVGPGGRMQEAAAELERLEFATYRPQERLAGSGRPRFCRKCEVCYMRVQGVTHVWALVCCQCF